MMIDTGATHNFVSEIEAQRLGLKIEKDVGRPYLLWLWPREYPSDWDGKTDLVVVPMDDFDVGWNSC